MSTNTNPQYQPGGYVPQPQPKQRRRWPWILSGTFFVAFGLGGAVVAADETVAVAPQPKVITKTETKTIEVEVAPQSCLDAVDHAEETLDIASQGFTIVSEVLNSASQFDVEGMTQGSAELEALTPSVANARGKFDASASACRATR